MSGEERYVITFVSIHDVTKAESRLKKRGIWCDMIPMPREIASDCGMALMFNAREADSVMAACSEESLRWEGVYSRAGGGHVPWRLADAD